MERTYFDYVNKTALTLYDDSFIDVKTGETLKIKKKMLEEIEYHSNNNTLGHLILSALNNYLYQKSPTIDEENTKEILSQLLEIKEMIAHNDKENNIPAFPIERMKASKERRLNINEIQDVLEAFGG